MKTTSIALTFLCERTDHWSEQRLAGMGQFFSKVGYKPTGEWKEEIVFYDPRRVEGDSPNDAVKAVYPNGAQVEIPPGKDPREVFADWLIDGSPNWPDIEGKLQGFSRAGSNRIHIIADTCGNAWSLW